MARERAFTLVEMLVAMAILAVLLAAGGIWLLGMHPGALTQATDDYDAALASARATAMTGSNGATLAFLPRTLGSQVVPGFLLRVFAGRPTAANAVSATTAMPVVSDATVSEKTLGAPPFAIFIGASGHASGRASYPSVDSAGNVSFAAVENEPACPSGGFVLTFVSPQGATMTRTLPCIAPASSVAGPPNPSPTPNVPVVTPTALVYHWPADAQQSFVATEWGYAHWFASTSGLSCGAGVAAYPDVLPSPYSAPYNAAEGEASPAPPKDEPYSYPNSGGGSMEDAPARFPLDPAAAGLCSATVRDEYDQRASSAVQVMGWLTATYGGVAYTHLSKTELSLPASVLGKKGASVTIPVSKTYDAQALQAAVAFDAACSSYVGASAASGTTPGAPSATPAKASVTLTLVSLPGSPLTCGGVIYDQYPGSQAGEGVAFNASIDPVSPLASWPAGEKISLSSPLWLDAKNEPCYAKAYGVKLVTADASDTSAPTGPSGQMLAQTDSTGCILNAAATPVPSAMIAQQTGASGGDFGFGGHCKGYLNAGSWFPNALGPEPGAQLNEPEPQQTTPPNAPCTVTLQGEGTGATSEGNVVAAVVNDPCGEDTPCYALMDGNWTEYKNGSGCGTTHDPTCEVPVKTAEVYKWDGTTQVWNAYADACTSDPVASEIEYTGTFSATWSGGVVSDPVFTGWVGGVAPPSTSGLIAKLTTAC
ncbi:MAG TPA: prepilin-type N-terminal cleavage/methylation domain-containing protein [Verrucomicrobiae bacterium]|nr:prepilin-type N-terminal cleavage/methylation domain-containing protein [Verrucomicrobiae bacterium]